MTAIRKTPAPSNSAGPFPGPGYLEAVLAEVAALWQYAKLPLSNVAGVDAITADCDVALDLNRKGNKFTFLPVGANTIPGVTMDINGKGALNLLSISGAALAIGRLQAGRMEEIENTGTEYRLTSPDPIPSSIITLHSVFAMEKAAGVNGGTPVANARTKYPFNTTIRNDIPSLAYNAGTFEFSLQAGDYEVEADIQMRMEGKGGLYLYNVTDAGDVAGVWGAQVGYIGNPRLAGKFTLAATKTLALHYVVTSAPAGFGLGLAVNDPSGAPERYGFIHFRKI